MPVLASPRTRRRALFALFFLPGLTMSSWVTRTPDVRDLLGASTAQMGLILFSLSVGSMVGILAAGPLLGRVGARALVFVGTALGALAAMTIGIGAGVALAPVVAVGLALFGLGMGCGEIALNVEGAEVERLIGRSTMPAMHGFFSLGTVVGAVCGMVLTAVEFPVVVHLVVVGALVAVVLGVAIRPVPPDVGRRNRLVDAAAGSTPRRAVWRDTRLLLIGAIILALAMAEGTANDWLPLVMVDGHGFDDALGSAVYAVFAASMTLGRFVGGWFVDRFGRAPVLCASAIAGAVGIALVIVVDHQAVAAGAAIFWGLGASLGFPVAMSAAAEGTDGPARVAFAAVVGYIAFLVGPPVLGFLGEAFGLRQALIVVLVVVVAAAFATPAARPLPTDPDGSGEAVDDDEAPGLRVR